MQLTGLLIVGLGATGNHPVVTETPQSTKTRWQPCSWLLSAQNVVHPEIIASSGEGTELIRFPRPPDPDMVGAGSEWVAGGVLSGRWSPLGWVPGLNPVAVRVGASVYFHGNRPRCEGEGGPLSLVRLRTLREGGKLKMVELGEHLCCHLSLSSASLGNGRLCLCFHLAPLEVCGTVSPR